MPIKNCLIVIPARYSSERFPGKVLAKIHGKPVLQWCYESAVKSGLGPVIIATEDKRVLEFAKSIGANAQITTRNCKSGTDRVYEIAKKTRPDLVINFQADEPFLEPETLKKTFNLLKKHKNCDIATACAPIRNQEELSDPNCVKIVLTSNWKALYFSRLPVPFHHPLSKVSKFMWYKHCGLYIYRYDALKKFVMAKESQLESLERLEQLRALELQMNIMVVRVQELGPAIDIPEDINKCEQYLIKYKRKDLI